MPINFDCDDVPDNFDGFDKCGPGTFHFQVTAVQEEGGNKGELIVDLEALAGTDATQAGKPHREYFTKPNSAQKKEARINTAKRMMLLALATKLITEEEIAALKKQGKGPSIDFTLAVGRQFVGKLMEEEYQGKKRCKMGFDLWPIGHPKAAGVPLNEGMLSKQGDASPNPFGDCF